MKFKSFPARSGIIPGNQKLTDAQALEILNSTKSVEELADKYNVSKSCIKGVKYGNNWKHLRGIFINK